MESMTKPRLSDADIRRLIGECLGAAVTVVEHEEFTDGWFNAAHAVRLDDGRDLVLKVAPEPGLKLLRYEVDLMHTEIEFVERASQAGVPMPRVWHSDPDRGIFIMDRLRGTSLELAKKAMPPAGLLVVRHELGRMCAAINQIPGDLFGYPRRDGHTRSASWRTSFMSFIDDVLADATETQRPLPRPADEIRNAMAHHASTLDEVTTPALVHFDLWDGNVFVIEGTEGWRVEGLIDGERAFYGDPIAELVSLISFIPSQEGDAVVDGYLGRPLTATEQTRLTLYRIYLWLVLIAETAVRGYPEEQNKALLSWTTDLLIRDLDEIWPYRRPKHEMP